MSSSPARTLTTTVDDPAQRRAILIGVCLALMAVVASVSGLNVAQQQVAVELGASQGTVLWIINLYTVSLAALLLPLGAVGDRWGRKPVLLAGLLVFGTASTASALAGSPGIMLGARLLSGIGAALIMPVTLSVITSTFPGQARSQAIGVWSAVAGAGGLLGMFLAALLVDAASWRYQFVLPVVLVIAAAAITLRSVPNSREPHTHPFDVAGSLASIVAVVGLVLAIHDGPERGWVDPLTLGSLIIGVLAGLGFVIWESIRQAPLFDVRLFRDRGLASGSAVLLTIFGVMGGIFVVLFPYFQAVLGWSGLHATLGLMPMALTMMGASGLAPRVSAGLGARWTMAGGILLAGTGLAAMALLVSADGGYLRILPGLVTMGLGAGLAMPPSTEAITGALPQAQQGVASALNDVTREFGTALGVALLGTVLSAGYRSAIEARLDGVPADVADRAREGIAQALSTGRPPSPELVRAAQEAFVDGWQQAMGVGVVVLALLLAYLVVRGPKAQGLAP